MISTHTPARGVTFGDTDTCSYPAYFYSHAREGRDPILFLQGTAMPISTHTPARGVTKDLCLSCVY